MRLSIDNGEIDVCSDDKDFVLVFDIGEVKTQDSLIGYELYFRYNPEVLTFSTVLTENTLTQQISELGVIYKVFYPGYAAIFAGNQIIPAAGKKPLVAIRGSYNKNCSGESEIKLNSFDPFPEYKKKILSLENTSVKAVVAKSPERNYTSKFVVDTLRLRNEDEKATEAEIKFPAIITEGRIKFFTDNKDFIPSSVQATDSRTEIKSDLNGDTVNVHWKKKQLLDTAKLSVNIIAKKEGTGRIIVEPIKTDSCQCIADMLGDTITVEKKITINNIEEQYTQTSGIEFYGNNLTIFSEKEIKSIEIWNLIGEKIFFSKPNEKYFSIETDEFPRIFLIQLETGLKIEYKYLFNK